jgi:hypothetical protein
MAAMSALRSRVPVTLRIQFMWLSHSDWKMGARKRPMQ